jgi:hypothetical protein
MAAGTLFIVLYYICLDIYIEKRVSRSIVEEFLKPDESDPEDIRETVEKISNILRKKYDL